MTSESLNFKNHIVDNLVSRAKNYCDFSDKELSFIRTLLDEAYDRGSDAGWSEGYQESQNEIYEKEV
jgi:hypothetical protein